MRDSWYSFEVSPVWVLAALIVALLFAILLYSKKNTPWSKSTNIFLGFLRLSSIFLIILLIINPILQYFVNRSEKPVIILAVDNSESVVYRNADLSETELKNWILNSRQSLRDQYDAEIITLDFIKTDSFSFDHKTTDISLLLNNIEEIYNDKNIASVVLISDGIVNTGKSPVYESFKFPVYTVGLGDTIPPRDIAIQEIKHNQVAYQGNKFPVSIQIFQKGFTNESLELKISESGKVLVSQNVVLDDLSKQLDVFLDAEESGLKRFTIDLSEKEGESSTSNNHKDIYINIIEGKDRVLILAPAPHPDISSIRNALSSTSNYETTVYIPGVSKAPQLKDFDLIIEHQAFTNTNYGEFKAASHWYILGENSNLKQLTQKASYLGIESKGNRKDKSGISYNPNFGKFKLAEELTNRLKNFPPLSVPFGDYQIAGPVEILFYQRIGSVITERPQMLFYDDGSNKSAISIGTGIWQWKLQESGSEDDSRLFNEIIQKSVQYLCVKSKQDRFIVKPRQANYQIGDQIILDTEIYNDIFERSYNNIISLNLTSETGQNNQFQIIDNPGNSSINLGTLASGIYQYTAQTNIDGKTLTRKGSFLVKDIQLEKLNLTANHRLLKQIAANNHGEFKHISAADDLITNLKNAEFQEIIHTEETKSPLIEKWWILAIIALFLTTEWFLRKFLGAY